jgi:hypothetical protein
METQVAVVNYEMYTSSGEKACQKLMSQLSSKILGERRLTGEEVERMLEDGISKIAKTHREVHDTEPRGELARQVSKLLKQAGYGFHFDSYQNLSEGLYRF